MKNGSWLLSIEHEIDELAWLGVSSVGGAAYRQRVARGRPTAMATDTRGLEERQIPAFPRYKIEGAMKSVDMTFLNRNNIHRHSDHSCPRESIPPLAERP